MNSKYTCRLAAIFFLCSTALLPAQEPTLHAVEQNGPRGQRLNMVFLSEGYTASELPVFSRHVQSAVNYLFSRDPWKRYRSYFNIYRIEVASRQSGTDNGSGGGNRDTYFDTGFSYPSIPQFLLLSHPSGHDKVYSILNTYLPEYNIPIMLVNDTKYGGSGGSIAVASINSSSAEILEHELGHSVAGLADEYSDQTLSDSATEAYNATRETRREHIRWRSWIEPATPIITPFSSNFRNVVGAFEGANYHPTGWFRPHYDSMMRSIGSGSPVGQVNAEKFVLSYYEKVSPFDAYSPAESFIEAASLKLFQFSVTPKSVAGGNDLRIQWFINGQPLPGATRQSLAIFSSELGDGIHSISATVSDPTSFVRDDPQRLLSQTVSWNVTVSNSGNPSPAQLFQAAGGWRAYLVANPDVYQAGIRDEAAAYRHWTSFGRAEHRFFNPDFSASDGWQAFVQAGGWQAYLADNRDLFLAGIHTEPEALNHWVNFGRAERRSFSRGKLRTDYEDGTPDPFFDIDGGFAWEYPPPSGGEYGDTMVFITKDAPKPAGWDGRALLLRKGDLFNLGPEYTASAYRALNPDVAQAIDAGRIPSFASVTDHYVKYGFKEGRVTNGNWTQAEKDAWNDEVYLARNPDVRDFFLGAQNEGWKLLGKIGFAHYINFGRWEGRTGLSSRPSEMVLVTGGTMPASSELPGAQVSSFRIGKYEVTWAEWQDIRTWAVANGYSDLTNVGAGSAGDHPVRDVNWYDVVKWSNARSEKEGLAPVYHSSGAIYRSGQSVPMVDRNATGYRLPTEAEWEWAARGGGSSKGYIYSGSNDLSVAGWFRENSTAAAVKIYANRGTLPVGGKVGNELGIHDMSGNAEEWVFGENGIHVRGGSWLDYANASAVSFRSNFGARPESRVNTIYNIPTIGFRSVRSLEK